MEGTDLLAPVLASTLAMLTSPFLRRLCAALGAVSLASLTSPASAQECTAPVWGSPVGAQWVEDSDGKLFAAGMLSPQTWGVARRDPEGWTLLPGVFDGRVRAIACSGDEVLVGGEFAAVNGLSAPGVVLYDGSDWQALGTGIDGVEPRVNAVEFFAGELYAGGDFSGAGGVSSPNLARFANGQWSDVASGLDGPVNDLVLHDGDLVVGGEFTDAGGLGLASVVTWDGALFAPVGPTVLPPVDRLDSLNGRLGALATGRLWLELGGDWFQPLNQPFDVYGNHLAFHDGGVRVAGKWNGFCLASGDEPCLIRSQFQNGSWSTVSFDDLGPTLDWLSMAEVDGTLYETGGTSGFIQYTNHLVLTDWQPNAVDWYADFTLSLALGCDDPALPTTVELGNLPPVDLAPGEFDLDVQSESLDQTGLLDLVVRQGDRVIHVPGAVVVRPTHTLSYTELFGFRVNGKVTAGALAGSSLFYISADTAAPLTLDGIFSPIALDLGQAEFIGLGTTTLFGGDFPGDLNLLLAEPLPPGLLVYSQVLVVELPPEGGPFVAVTPLVATTIP